MQDAFRNLGHKSGKLSASSVNELSGSDSGSKKYRLPFVPVDAVILHPSFLCPALKKTGDDLNLFVLGDWRFNTTFLNAEGKKDNKAGPTLSGAVNRFLKIVDWSSIDKTRHASKPLFSTTPEAVNNIEVYYLWELSELDDRVLTDKDGKPFAQIHPDVLSQYRHNKLYWGFQIVIKNLPADQPGLYDISWMNYEKPKTEDETGYFYELQDQYFNEFNTRYRGNFHPLRCDVTADDRPVFFEEPTELQSYHPLYISDKPCLDIGHLSDVHVSARQHLFTQSQARLIDGKGGHRSDPIGPMVNTSYATLKDLMKQMGDDVDLLVFTGDLIDYNRNYNPNNSVDDPQRLKKSSGIWQALNLDNLTDHQRYPIGIDNLVMYELFRWYYRTYKKPILLISGNHEAYTLPYGISPRVKVLRSANSTYNFFHRISVDEIIAKSIDQAKKDADKAKAAVEAGRGPNIYDNRANEGIPADHNLTITEAILMYGPDYARVVMSASYNWGNEKNFRAENLKWFFHIFTPLTSYYLPYGDQCFIGLGWGDDERFVDHVPKVQGEWKAGGFLPRSVEGVTDPQLTILNQALDASKRNNVLCTHFTFVNYNTSRPISETGLVDSDDYGRHDYGTFETNRETVYPIVKDKIQYALSGHSHRSGLYQITKTSYRAKSNFAFIKLIKQFEVHGQAAVNGKFHPNGGARLLVAASGGPIPVQNHANELYNWGLDRPSGNVIKFNGSSEAEIAVKTARVPQSKPRLAVALDYADIFLRDDDKGGVFATFESNNNKSPFAIKFSDEVKLSAEKTIKRLTLVLYKKDGSKIELAGTADPSISDKQGLHIQLEPNADKYLRNAAVTFSMGYIDLSLSLEHVDGTTYDNSTDWIYPIEAIDRQQEAIDQLESAITASSYSGSYIPQSVIDDAKKKIRERVHGFRIQRHSLYGEIPKFDFYIKAFKSEYA